MSDKFKENMDRERCDTHFPKPKFCPLRGEETVHCQVRESMPVINQGVHHSREPFVKGGSLREDAVHQAREDAIS